MRIFPLASQQEGTEGGRHARPNASLFSFALSTFNSERKGETKKFLSPSFLHGHSCGHPYSILFLLPSNDNPSITFSSLTSRICEREQIFPPHSTSSLSPYQPETRTKKREMLVKTMDVKVSSSSSSSFVVVVFYLANLAVSYEFFLLIFSLSPSPVVMSQDTFVLDS